MREARAQQQDLWRADAGFRSTRLPRLLAFPFVAWVLPFPLDLPRGADVYGSSLRALSSPAPTTPSGSSGSS